MLNMLIAIMSDTFEHTIENRELNSNKTKIGVMSELAENIFEKEDGDPRRFMFIITPDLNEQEDTETWEGTIK